MPDHGKQLEVVHVERVVKQKIYTISTHGKEDCFKG
jgi:hypothetical protein